MIKQLTSEDSFVTEGTAVLSEMRLMNIILKYFYHSKMPTNSSFGERQLEQLKHCQDQVTLN